MNLLAPDILWEWQVFIATDGKLQVIGPRVDMDKPEERKRAAEAFIHAAEVYAQSLGLRVTKG